MTAPDQPSHPAGPSRLVEVIIYFTQLGFTAFGGPAAHIALMERQLVEQRRWLDRRHFLDLVSAVNLIPGPNSTQLAISLGYLRAGLPGLIAAGVCFILPAMMIILPIAYLYVQYGQTPHAAAAMRGVGATVLAVVAIATWRLGRASITDRFSIAIAIAAAFAAFIGHQQRWPATDLMILAVAAMAGIARGSAAPRNLAILLPFPIAAAAAPGGLLLMALLFLKIGSTLYGSGYLLLPYLRANFVTAHLWLSERQLLDAVAVGQITPGPLLTTATFVGFIFGYQSHPTGQWIYALSAAILATAAIFAPSFFFIGVLGNILPRLRNHPAARGALDAMNPAVVSLIAVTVITMAVPALQPPGTWLTAALAAATAAILWRWEINATWPILAAAVIAWWAGEAGWL
jgi:chromate transporter